MISAVFGKRRSLSRTLTAGTICAALISGHAVMASADDGQGATGEAIIHADDHPGNWMTYGRTYSEQRYSPLDQINRSNVGNLKLAWYLDLDTNRGRKARRWLLMALCTPPPTGA